MSNIINKTGLSCKTLSMEWMRRHWRPLFRLYLGHGVVLVRRSRTHAPHPRTLCLPFPERGEINLLVSRLTVEINCWNLVPSKCYIPVQDINITNLKEPKWLHNGALSACMTLAGHTKLARFHNWKFSPVHIFSPFFISSRRTSSFHSGIKQRICDLQKAMFDL